MKARLTILFILMLVALTSGCGTSQVDHIAIIDAYEEAFKAGDVDAAVALFTDDAAVLTSIGDFRGKEGIREFVQLQMRSLLADDPFGERLNIEETGNTLDYDERFLRLDGTTGQLHHAYVFENGKIKEWAMSDFQTIE